VYLFTDYGKANAKYLGTQPMSTDFQLQELRHGLDYFTDSTKVSFDYQFIANPGYNADRAPVNVFAGRFHSAFSGRSSQKFLTSRWEHRNGGALAWD
jgi:hypothetical protein